MNKDQAELYDKRTFENSYSLIRLKKIMSYLPNKNINVLDIGCGSGQFNDSVKLYRDNINYNGLDISKKQISICKEKGYNCKLYDVSKPMSFNKKKFDVIIASEIIEHIFNTDQFILNLKSLLNQDGILIITTPNSTSIGNRIRLVLGKSTTFEYHSRTGTSGHIRYFDYNASEDIIEFNKMKVINIIGRNFLIPKAETNKYARFIDNLACKLFKRLSNGYIIIAKKSNV